jgi:hypothetical protein
LTSDVFIINYGDEDDIGFGEASFGGAEVFTEKAGWDDGGVGLADFGGGVGEKEKEPFEGGPDRTAVAFSRYGGEGKLA